MYWPQVPGPKNIPGKRKKKKAIDHVLDFILTRL